MAILDLITKEDFQQFKLELFRAIKELNNPQQVSSNSYLRSAEVRQILKISSGTLQKFRINGVLPYEKIGGIFYYAQQDIDKLLGEIGNL